MNIPAYLWHPIFVHFSVALLSVATLFYVLAALFPRAVSRNQWIDFGRWNLWIGSGISVVTVLLGWLAYNTVNHDDPSHEAMEVHATLALITLGTFGCIALWVALHKRLRAEPSRMVTGSLLIAFAFLVATGLRGGELVFHYGLAVDSLPKSEVAAGQAPTPATSVEPPDSKKEAITAPAPHHHHHKHPAKHAE